ncbi:MAG: glycosyltransferase family 4 protein [Spirosomataceae bacterium]
MSEKKEKTRILIIHLFVWAHYKAKIYSELYALVQNNPEVDVKVVQLSISEGTRTKMGMIDWSLHQYPMHVLYRDMLENTPFIGRFLKLLRWVLTYKPHVVNVQGYFDPAMNLILLYCKMVGIKVIMASDSTELDNPNVGWRESIKRYLVRKSDGFFCYGTKSADYMVKLGASKEQILVANNAVDNQKIEAIHKKAMLEREKKKEELNMRKFNFIFVGRLIPFKNVVVILEAFRKIHTNSKDWGVIILGDGVELDKMKEFCSKHALSGVHFISGKSWFEVPKWFALADVFVLPSYSEPWGLVANEAMACSLPVIISERCGCAIDLVKEGENGFVFNPYSVDELAEKMHFFIENTNSLTNMGESSKQIIQNFSPKIVASEMLEGFKKGVHENRKSKQF